MTSTPLDEILPESHEEPAKTEEPVTEQPTTESVPDRSESSDQTMVPKAALDEARGKARRYTEEVTAVRERLGSLEQQNQRLMQMLAQNQQRQNPPPPPPDWYENPEGATLHAVQRAYGQYLQQLQQARQEQEQMLHANARMIAESRYDEATVNAAEQAFMEAIQKQSLEPADYDKVVRSPNRYAAAVAWYKRQQAQQEIGDDPTAYREKVRAEILAEMNGGQGGGRAPTMPSNFAGARNVGSRSGPAWSGPKALTDIFKT
jgi:hypothetical protein